MKKFLMLTLVAGSFALLGAGSAQAASPTCNQCQAPAVAAAQPTAPAATMAQGTQVRRSFSVEPGRSIYTPMRRVAPSRTPAYLLPKSDARRFGSF